MSFAFLNVKIVQENVLKSKKLNL